jgi:hypothetical protein
MNLHVQNAKLKGQEVAAFTKLSHCAQFVRKSWHLEVASKYAAMMKGLIYCAKEYGCVEEYWGCHTLLSETTDITSTSCKAKRQVDHQKCKTR